MELPASHYQHEFLKLRMRTFLEKHNVFGTTWVGKRISFRYLSHCSNAREASFIASLEENEPCGCTKVKRYVVTLNRHSGRILECEEIRLREEELSTVLKQSGTIHATGDMLSCTRFKDERLVSYKLSVKQPPPGRSMEYVVQLRPKQVIEPMQRIMKFLQKEIRGDVLPIPSVIPISLDNDKKKERTSADDGGGESFEMKGRSSLEKVNPEKEMRAGMGLHVTRFVEGRNAKTVYPHLTHDCKLAFVANLGKALNALWSIPLEHDRNHGVTGELELLNWSSSAQAVVTKVTRPTGRRMSIGGIFRAEGGKQTLAGAEINTRVVVVRDSSLPQSITEFIAAHVIENLGNLREQEGVDSFKRLYLRRLETFVVHGGLARIPPIVEQVPIVFTNKRFNFTNIIVDAFKPEQLIAVTDWSSCEARPLPEQIVRLEKELTSRPHANFSAGQYEHLQDILDSFWKNAPNWERQRYSVATEAFLDWYEFAEALKVEPPPSHMPKGKHGQWWAENAIRVEGFLKKHSHGDRTAIEYEAETLFRKRTAEITGTSYEV